MGFPSVNEQMDLIRRGAEEIIPEDELVRKLERSQSKNTPLIIKLGCDPSSPDLSTLEITKEILLPRKVREHSL